MSAITILRLGAVCVLWCYAWMSYAQTTVSVVSRHAVDHAILETLTFATGAYSLVREGEHGRLEVIVLEVGTRWENASDDLRVVKYSIGTTGAQSRVVLGFMTLAGTYRPHTGGLLEARVPRLDSSIEHTTNRVYVLCLLKEGELTVSYNNAPLELPAVSREAPATPGYVLRVRVKSSERSSRLVTPARPANGRNVEVPPTEFAIPGAKFRTIVVSYELESDFLKAAPQETLYSHHFALRTKAGDIVQPVACLDKRIPYPQFYQITTVGWFYYEAKKDVFGGEAILAFVDSDQLDDAEVVLASPPPMR